MKLFGLVISVLALVACSSTSGTPDIEKTAEFEVQMIVAQAAEQVAAELTAQPPTQSPAPLPTRTPTPTPPSTPTWTPVPTATPIPTPIPTLTPTPRPTSTPIPRFLGQQYLAIDNVTVTLNSLSATEVENATTVSVSYTLKNTTKELKEEKAWKLYYQGTGGLYFGVRGDLLPGQSIDRTFTLTAVAPFGLLMLAYPAEFSDNIWDGDDLTWDVTRLLLP